MMKQIDAYFTYIGEVFKLWRQAQRAKLMLWLEARKNCLKFELRKDAVVAKSRGVMFLRLVYLKLFGIIVTKLDELLTRGN